MDSIKRFDKKGKETIDYRRLSTIKKLKKYTIGIFNQILCFNQHSF